MVDIMVPGRFRDTITTSDGITFGSMYLAMREKLDSPNALPVSRNAMCFRDMVFALTGRAYPAHATKEIAITVFVRPLPMIVTTARARIVPGIIHVRSVRNERTLSVHFPK